MKSSHHKQHSHLAISLRKFRSSREGFARNCLTTKVGDISPHFFGQASHVVLRRLYATKTSMASPHHNNGSDKRQPNATSSLESLDHATLVHQAPSIFFKRLRDHGHGDAFHKTFHMNFPNFPWLKPSFFKNCMF